jgi:hypothetical protein
LQHREQVPHFLAISIIAISVTVNDDQSKAIKGDAPSSRMLPSFIGGPKGCRSLSAIRLLLRIQVEQIGKFGQNRTKQLKICWVSSLFADQRWHPAVRAYRGRRRRGGVPASVRHGARRYRRQAPRQPLPIRTLPGMDQGQKPGASGDRASDAHRVEQASARMKSQFSTSAGVDGAN